MDALILKDIDELRRRLAPHVRRARRVVALGSVARGETDIYDVWPRVDLLIYTPAELDRLMAEGNPLVLRALSEGIVLHEAEQVGGPAPHPDPLPIGERGSRG